MEWTGAHVAIVVVVVIAVYGVKIFLGANAEPEDPKPMSDENLAGAIAGQADWLEKAHRLEMQTILREGLAGEGIEPGIFSRRHR